MKRVALIAGFFGMTGLAGFLPSAFSGTVTLNGASGTSCTYTGIATDASGNVTVTCGDTTPPTSPTVSVSVSPTSLNEGASAQVTVTLSGGSPNGQSVTLSRSGGSASSGSDYTAFTQQSVTFTAGGASSYSFPLQTTDDADVEASETVTFSLTSPSAGLSIGTSSATLTINQSDQSGGACTTPAGTSVGSWSSFNNRGVTFATGTINSGAVKAFAFTLNSSTFPNGATISMERDTAKAGGTNAKDVSVSTCPGDFSSPAVKCRINGRSTGSIFTSATDNVTYCQVSPGQTYYLNIKPSSGNPNAAAIFATY